MSSPEEIEQLMTRLSMRSILQNQTRVILEYFGRVPAPLPQPRVLALPDPPLPHGQLPGVELAPVALYPPAPQPAVVAAPPVHLQAAEARLHPAAVNFNPPVAAPLVDQPPPYGAPLQRPVFSASAPIVLAPLPLQPQAPGGAAFNPLGCCGQKPGTSQTPPQQCQQRRGIRDHPVQSAAGHMVVKLCGSHKGQLDRRGLNIYIDAQTVIAVHSAAVVPLLPPPQSAPLIPPSVPGLNSSVNVNTNPAVGPISPVVPSAPLFPVPAVLPPSTAVPTAQGSPAPIRPPPPVQPRAVSFNVELEEEEEEDEKKEVHVDGDVPAPDLVGIHPHPGPVNSTLLYPAVGRAQAPFRWVGAKRDLLPVLERLFPRIIRHYYEVCLGAGNAAIQLMQDVDNGAILLTGAVYLSDKCWPVVNFWIQMRDNVTVLVSLIQGHCVEYDTTEHKSDLYARWRDAFNEDPNREGASAAALFICLLCTSYNGLFQVNREGHFNTSWGRRRTCAVNCHNLLLLSALLCRHNVNIAHHSFQLTPVADDASHDFYYIDPPWKDCWDKYTADGFDASMHSQLVEWCQRTLAHSRWLLSNSDSDWVRAQFPREKYMVQDVIAHERMSPTAHRRKELLIWKRPEEEAQEA